MGNFEELCKVNYEEEEPISMPMPMISLIIAGVCVPLPECLPA